MVAGLIGLLVVYMAANPTTQATPATTTRSAAATVERPSQVIGQDRHLRNSDGSVVLLAISKNDLDQVIRAIALDDKLGMQQLLVSGRYFQVPNATPVHVLDTDTVSGIPARQVRVLSGAHVADAGWVLANSLSP